jgi:HD-GYP domain-containing protein (c-di-GMP phosphodiesterase class II)
MASSGDFEGLIRRLSAEFKAPIGLLDSGAGSWVLRLGAPYEVFPKLAPGLVAATSTHGRSVVWRGEEPSDAVWLLVPVAGEANPLVAVAGFAASNASPGAIAWGPHCPEPALKAWGQSIADQLLGAKPPRAKAQSESSKVPSRETRPVGDGGERMIIARLIRRLRISDQPEQFQQLATKALRAALGLEAVAWVPCHHSEAVVVSGDVGRLKPNCYRTLIPGPHEKEPVYVDNAPLSLPDPEIRRIVAVAADSHRSIGWLVALNPLDGGPFSPSLGELIQPVASLIATQQINARVYGDLKELLFGVIRALTAAIDAKDPYTSGHSERVARIAVRLGEELGMSPNQRGDLYLMGLLHDVGKIGVDDAVLKKPGSLTPEEYRQIQAHVEIGVHILTDLKKLNHLLPGVRHHHESLDGSGYPCGLAGEAIPLEARILAVADSYDAMSSTRPYRRRLTPSQIDDILRNGSGVQWDSKIIDALFSCRMDLEMIRQKGLGDSLQNAVSETLGRT